MSECLLDGCWSRLCVILLQITILFRKVVLANTSRHALLISEFSTELPRFAFNLTNS